MSLQGTFDTLAPTDVLGLLARAEKTGGLRLAAGTVDGRVWLHEGRCRAVEAAGGTGPPASAGEVHDRLVELCFALGRQSGGTFRFEEGEDAPWNAGADTDLDGPVAEATALLDEWASVRESIGSLEAVPRLRAALGVPAITLDADQWRVVAAVDGRHDVEAVARAAGVPLLAACHALAHLAEQGAADLGDAPAPAPAAPAVVPEEPYGPGVDPEAGDDPAGGATPDAAAAEPGEGEEDRGALLRLFSALRDG